MVLEQNRENVRRFQVFDFVYIQNRKFINLEKFPFISKFDIY